MVDFQQNSYRLNIPAIHYACYCTNFDKFLDSEDKLDNAINWSRFAEVTARTLALFVGPISYCACIVCV